MAEQNALFPFKEAEQYITLLQENITRMASNSANCKNWLVAIIAGALAVAFAKENASYLQHVFIFLIAVTWLFYFLDCLYLGLERRMKDAEKAFVRACQEGDEPEKLFMTFRETVPEDKGEARIVKWVKKRWEQLLGAICALDSWSTTPVYLSILIMLHVMMFSLVPDSCCCCSLCGC